jgi:uroporphyrinogen-III synthase
VKALVTRPREQAEALAAALRARGIEPVIEPLVEIRLEEDGPRVVTPLLLGAQALVFTSANGVRAFAAASARRDLPALAVGDATARAARDAGFSDVASAQGNVADLATLARQRLKPSGGALVHSAARVVAGDLAGALGAFGYEVRRAILYESVMAERLSEATSALIGSGALGAAIFFSPRTAATFVRLVRAAGLDGACRTIAAVALSQAVAEKLDVSWRAVHVALSPTGAALIEACERAVKEQARAEPS